MDKVLVLFFGAITLHASYANPSYLIDDPSRIVNGSAATDLQFPYVVSLQALAQVGQASRGHSCGGALINLQHVVTSASCLYVINATTGAYVMKSPAAYRVFAGGALLTNDASANRWRTVQTFVSHPNYLGPPSSVNDIGVIVLTTPFPNNAGLIPLGLPSTTAPADNTNCSVAGWGAAAPGAATMNNQLLFAHKYICNLTLCTNVLNPQPSAPNVVATMLCASSYNNNSRSCSNDTGNALVCGGTLAGVLSWHAPCVTVTGWPEVFTRASSYATWLSTATGGAGGGGGGAGGGGTNPGAGTAISAPALAATLLLATAVATLAHRTDSL